MKSTPFDGQHGHIVEFHIRRAAVQRPGGGTWVHGAVTASDEDMMDTVTGSLVDQADPSYSGLPCLEAKEILGLIQPWLVGSKMQDEIACDLAFTRWQDRKDVDLHYGGASFEVEFGDSEDAHLGERLAQYYYITDKEGNIIKDIAITLKSISYYLLLRIEVNGLITEFTRHKKVQPFWKWGILI
jgi:hypothetical protein